MTSSPTTAVDEDEEACLSGGCDEWEECSYCEGSGLDYEWSFDGRCSECGGSGGRVPEHCCVCGGSPYCVCCRTCSNASVGYCRCPITTEIDGKQVTL